MTWSSLSIWFRSVAFFSNTISSSYVVNNEDIPYCALHVSHMHIGLAATNVELGSSNITWNLLEPSIDGNTFNLAAALSDSKSFLSISFTMYCRCLVLWRVSSRYYTISPTSLKNFPAAIALRKVVLARPLTWSTSPFPCFAILKIRITFTWNLFASVCMPWKWADDLYW